MAGAWQTSDPGELFHRQFEHRLDGKVREHWRRISPQHDKRERLLTQFPHLASKLVDDLGPKPDKRPGDAFPIGERILVHATVLEKCSSNWRSWLDRHAAADFGEHGTLCEPGEIARWLSSAASTAEANSLAIEAGRDWSRAGTGRKTNGAAKSVHFSFPAPANARLRRPAPGFIHKRPVVSTRGFPGLRAFYPPEFQPSHVQGYADRISTWFEYLGNQRDLPGYLVLLAGIREDMKKEEAILEQSIERALAFLGLNRGGK